MFFSFLRIIAETVQVHKLCGARVASSCCKRTCPYSKARTNNKFISKKCQESKYLKNKNIKLEYINKKYI